MDTRPRSAGGAAARQGLHEERRYWAEHLPPGRRDAWMDRVLDPALRQAEFPHHFWEFVRAASSAARGHRRRVLDLGSGPLSPLAWGVTRDLFELVAIDPLADAYSEMTSQHGIDHPVRPVPGRAEELETAFPAGSFDAVYCRNALDHCEEPAAVLDGIRHVLRPGGIFYLHSKVREGTANAWAGLHQHDLLLEGEKLLSVDRTGRRTWLNQDPRLTPVLAHMPDPAPGSWMLLVTRRPAERSCDGLRFQLRRQLARAARRLAVGAS